MRVLLGLVAGLGALAVGAWASTDNAAAVPPSAEGGAEIAARWCAGCHVVAPSGVGNDTAASFPSIAGRRDSGELRLFLAQPHARPMRGFTLTSREIEDVVAYIETMEQRTPR